MDTQKAALFDMAPVRFDGKKLALLDQTKLPGEEIYIEIQTKEDMWDAIYHLKVRGAPAIGVAAAYGLYADSLRFAGKDMAGFREHVKKSAEYLESARPTAVNLAWALKRMFSVIKDRQDLTVEAAQELLRTEAVRIHDEDVAACKAMGEYGLSLLKPGMGILTHCNAGPLATARYGTALGPILLGTERGMSFHVFSDETRPLLQGARLTSYELQRAGVDVTLICDNMASIVMKNGWVQACFVGCDRVAANGDTANKIGTSGVAILAKHYGIPVYVLGPTSTIDMNCPDGNHIPIEERDPEEIKTMWYAKPMALPEVKCYNPAFDVTDHDLIAGIVTEKGICRPPYTKSLKALFADKK